MKKSCAHPHHKGRENLSALTGRLRDQARKITGPRQAILDVLRRHEHPITTREILAELPRGLCDLATIYRSMHLLEEMGMVQRFDFGDGAARFELVAHDEDDGHHHHLVCRKCAAVVEITDCFSPELQERIQRESRFKSITHKLEFFGLCPGCQ
jgi:Fur family transcriptional regulator, ferric uptake regulator